MPAGPNQRFDPAGSFFHFPPKNSISMRCRMLYRSITAAVLVACAASFECADVPLPPNQKYIDPRVQFEGVGKYEDQVFVLKFNTGSGNPFAGPPVYLDVKNSEPFNLNAQRRLVNMELFAVERKEYEKHKNEPKKDWLTTKTAGVLSAGINAPGTVAPADQKEVPVTRYRVEISDGKLKVEKAATEKKQSDASPAEPRSSLANVPSLAVGVALALSMATFGLWLVRRR
jgi:hypothetical protein